MDGASLSQRTAQLDKAEREYLENVVTEMRERIEDNVEYQLRQQDLDEEPDESDSLDEDTQQLVEAIELEAVDGHTWEEAFEEYVTGVGYTIVNRLAALRCMEVRDFINEEVTVFKDNGLTPAAETLVNEEFLMEDEALLEAYHNACDELAEEIEILFDRSTPYSLVDPDDDTFEELCGMLDSVPDEVWRADDVLGWVYEYYNVKLLDDLRRKGDREGLEPEDVPPANQFYTPHWVVRMLTDNSLGKLYLEHTGELQDVVEAQEAFSPDERKNRPLSPDESPDIADFCTYLVPSEEEGEPTDFDHPEELRVIDPACGSGHFLLYAFDVLERIWRAETDLAHEEIPREILRHNLYGIDLDMRACQLAAFNLYLKGRTRAETKGDEGFEMPEIGIVCSDARIADVEGVKEVFDEISDGRPEVEEALRHILDAFEEVHGLGSLLDVRGTLGDLFEDDSEEAGVQITLSDDPREEHTLEQILHSLRNAVDQHHDTDSFLAQDLRSFIRLLDILAQDYDVTLMNPPYGAKGRMPDTVQNYVEEHYEYYPEFYINFVEVCNEISADHGRIGMLIPRSFMFKRSFEKFRRDFQGEIASFDFLAEFGLGILDNATVRTVGTVLRSGTSTQQNGTFIRLEDPASDSKERVFTEEILGNQQDEIQRIYQLHLSEFNRVPKSPMSYWTPEELRSLFAESKFIDADVAQIDGKSISDVKTGLQTGDNPRFVRNHWEISFDRPFFPFAKGGKDAWILPRTVKTVWWKDGGSEIKRISSSRPQNIEYYFREGITWTYIKETGRRFGYYPDGGIFDQKGPMVFPNEASPWTMQVILNSELYHGLFLALTPDREWNPGDVGRIPYDSSSLKMGKLEQIARDQYDLFVSQRQSDPTSPYYVAPSIVPADVADGFFYEQHPHTEKANSKNIGTANEQITTETPLAKAIEIANEQAKRRQEEIKTTAGTADQYVYNSFDISDKTRTAIQREIRLRGSTSPTNIFENKDTLDYCKNLVHHFAMDAIRDEEDGIIPVNGTGDRADLLSRIVEQFHDMYGEYAENRLAEVDEILGEESATHEAYPNLQRFLEDDLFTYHVRMMQNTPILWKLSTERLLADPKGEGFACFVDYHSLDEGLFDRLSNQYLEPRKADLRERRSAANRRRSDDSLSTSEQAEAAEAYERSTSALEQISVFEDVVQDLSDTTERDFNTEHRELAADLAPKVASFREETETRLQALDDLRELKSEEWFEDTFSPNFWSQIEELREEWLDALETLEHASKEYSKPTDEPVEAHLADLFDYFSWRLKGSGHYSSTGILFMTYYFEREGKTFVNDEGDPKAGLQDEYTERLAILAARLDEYKSLADNIEMDCKAMTNATSSDWSDRALSEITTAGYRPNHKHGVAINITPLADAKIVPKIIEDQVI
jgi:hypothetical protein